MKLLISSATERLPARLARDLAASHDIRLTDHRTDPQTPDLVVSALGHDAATDDVVRGVDAIIHWGGTDPETGPSDRLDHAMCRTYNLLRAASEERVARVVYLSSLDVLKKYNEEYTVTETWRPSPTTDTSTLCYHLGEYVCREFAREQRLSVVCLRLGDLDWNGDSTSTSALYVEDAVRAVELGLTAESSGDATWTLPDPIWWQVFHVQSDVANARFATTEAREALGFSPVDPSSPETAR